jgi:hypothetical protein
VFDETNKNCLKIFQDIDDSEQKRFEDLLWESKNNYFDASFTLKYTNNKVASQFISNSLFISGMQAENES